MNTKYVDFIGMYDTVFPDGFCSHLISEFEMMMNRGLCGNRQDFEGVQKTEKQDYFIGLNLRYHAMNNFNGKTIQTIILDGLQKCFDSYETEYDVLKDAHLIATHIKMQRTDPGSGYHLWHCEQGNGENSGRCLVWASYLNTIEDAGETEFLYQRLRIPPKENTMVIWPAGFTHTHRGNVVHGNKSKYIITGWFYLD